MALIKQISVPFSAPKPASRALGFLIPFFCLLLMAGGCSRFRKEQHETVYVNVQKKFLRDRVAAVSNRVCEVQIGQPLEVQQHWRRFYKVKTQANQIGWIEDSAVIDSQEYQGFEDLAAQHAKSPVVATAVIRDDATLHLTPGRDTAHFYYLTANTRVQLYTRASVVKKTAAQAKPATAEGVVPPPPPMEDWWLVKDEGGHMGWVLGGRVDVELPDEIAIFGEGQRIVGAYVLKNVTDAESDAPNHEVPEYVTVLGPRKSGLPYDFDQVRVFTWSTKRHRYETAFRLKPVQGYLPVTVETQNGNPVFSVRVGNGTLPTPDPKDGTWKPQGLRNIQYTLVDTTVKRSGIDMGPIPMMRPADNDSADGKAKAKAKAKKR